MRLLKSSAPEARHAQSAHDAETRVRMALQRNRSSLAGLDELLREHYTINSDRDILAAVRNGDWVLVTDSSAATARARCKSAASTPAPSRARTTAR
ncbi:hypothetical protein [Pseudomonas chlororaphis]|uniref:hypothetical protein n=1 Tax=Pseudomonas chlororaphis TaxID=587753 RepID=UPI0021551876|nr:hypothetical protein [Pseudomonas chlororaphis]